MSKAKKINQLLNLGAAHAYYFHAGNWYHRLKRFPAILIDKNGYIRFQNENQYFTTPGVDISRTNDNQVHVPLGIMSLPGYQYFSELEKSLIAQEIDNPSITSKSAFDEQVLRTKRNIDAILRNQILVIELKNLYKNRCQICGVQLSISSNRCYSEIHHIKPLGQPHNGPDVKENMICVCPNHHALLDFFAIRLDQDKLKIKAHSIGESFIQYHNERFVQLNSALD